MYSEDNYGDWMWFQQAYGVEFDDGWTVDEPVSTIGKTEDKHAFINSVLDTIKEL